MTPEEAKAHEKAIEALIGASLLAPDKEEEITDEEISRYVEQRVTLSPEDKAALEETKPALMKAIKEILQADKREERDCPTEAETTQNIVQLPATRSRASEEFIEAIVIAQLTKLLAKSDFPLGRKRYNKLAYLSHRKAEEDVRAHYLKKAAGPYSPWARYQGPESIAVKSRYVKRAKVGVFEGLVVGENIDKIDQYLSRYPVCAAINWVVSKFGRRTNDQLELLATVDFAAFDLRQQGTAITMGSVKYIIETNKEWAPKLKRDVFSDLSIERALVELRSIFPTTYA